MKTFLASMCVLAASVSTSAFADGNHSACVLLVQDDGSAQFSCDGSALANLLDSSGMSAALSSGIQHFLNQGYTLSNCTDGNEVINNVNAPYSRCYFVK